MSGQHTRWPCLLTTPLGRPTSQPLVLWTPMVVVPSLAVVVPSLVAHELPERESSPVGEHLESGARVLVQATCGGWLQLAPDYESQLLCGGAVAAAGWVEERAEGGRALRSLEKRLPSSTTYQVTRAGGPCFAWSSPGGAGEKRPLETLQYEARVAVEAECGHWVKLKGVPQPAWVELDVFLAG
mmetsp:Transcript_47155/g.151699  ORF Transcript_47155/g.151699 Transcript_47155/m.151699 type:complete len:184 (+) Transcript_47155:585-1136(+)